MANYGMLLDLDRCIGCYACVVACKMCYGTRPGVNYNAVKTVEWGDYPNAKQRFLLTMCNHCEEPPCVDVCPTGATYKTEDGPVIVDYDLCIGCGACLSACPYNERYLVTDEETQFKDYVAPYENESSERLNVVEKCTFCYHRVQEGMQPMCTVMCPGQCRIFGDLDDPESDVSIAIKEKNAVNIEGTSMYYNVPEGMNLSYLPLGLNDAIAAAKKAGSEDETTSKQQGSSMEESSESAKETEALTDQASGGGNNNAVLVGVGAAAAAAIAGVTIGVKKSKNKKSSDHDN